MLMQAMRADEPGPLDRGVRQQAHAEPDDAVRAELHQHAGVQHRYRGRCRGVAVRRPGVQRPDAGQDAEPDVERQEHPGLQRRDRMRIAADVRNENDCDPPAT